MNLSAHQLTMTVLVTPDMANFAGNVHGGYLLKFLDQAAYSCASRYAGRYVVTLFASINYTGKTSMEVGVKVVTENIQAQIARHTNSCYFTMVAVDEQGKPVAVPPFTPKTADERRRHEAAQMRKALRQEMELRF